MLVYRYGVQCRDFWNLDIVKLSKKEMGGGGLIYTINPVNIPFSQRYCLYVLCLFNSPYTYNLYRKKRQGKRKTQIERERNRFKMPGINFVCVCARLRQYYSCVCVHAYSCVAVFVCAQATALLFPLHISNIFPH